MGLWRFLLVFALAFGSVLPHCAAAAPVPTTAVNHLGMAHDEQKPAHHPSKAPESDACIGCAAPVRTAFAPPAAPMIAEAAYSAAQSAPTTRVTALDPPPPRPTA